MAPKVEPIDLHFDEATMSSYGVELIAARARLVQRSYRVDNHAAELHLSVRGLYDPYLRLDKPSEYESLSLVVEMLKHPSGAVPSLAVPQRFFDLREKARFEIVEQISLGYSAKLYDPKVMKFRLRCIESASGNDDRFEPTGSTITKFQPEILGAKHACGCELTFQTANAGIFIYDPDDDPTEYDASHYLGGSYRPCQRTSVGDRYRAAFDSLSAIYVDSEGFQLYKTTHHLDLQYSPERRIPFSWAASESIPHYEFSARPKKLMIRCEGSNHGA